MSITESQLRAYSQSWWHWSHFFQDWLMRLIVDGRVKGHTDEQLKPLFDQLRTEIGEDHPGLLLKTFPGLMPGPPSAAITAMIEYVSSLSFEEGVYALWINEQISWRVYDRIVSEAEQSKIEADLAFFKQHLELDKGEHQKGAEKFYHDLVGELYCSEGDPRWEGDQPPQFEPDICRKLVALRVADLVVTLEWHDLVDIDHASQWLKQGHGSIGSK
jgi:hypothetical protein